VLNERLERMFPAIVSNSSIKRLFGLSRWILRGFRRQRQERRQGQRQGQRQRQRQRTAAHPRCRGRQRWTDNFATPVSESPTASNTFHREDAKDAKRVMPSIVVSWRSSRLGGSIPTLVEAIALRQRQAQRLRQEQPRHSVVSWEHHSRAWRARAPPPWWRGLPARAKATRLRSSNPTTGRMPVAPWAAAAGTATAAGAATAAGQRSEFRLTLRQGDLSARQARSR
jgi:hypothetical protein